MTTYWLFTDGWRCALEELTPG